MSRTEVQFHAKTIERQIVEMEAAEAAGDTMTAEQLWDAIKFRKQALAKRGVILV